MQPKKKGIWQSNKYSAIILIHIYYFTFMEQPSKPLWVTFTAQWPKSRGLIPPQNETQCGGCRVCQTNKSKDLTLHMYLTMPCFSGKTAVMTCRMGYRQLCTGKKHRETQKTVTWYRQNKLRSQISELDYLPQLLLNIRPKAAQI